MPKGIVYLSARSRYAPPPKIGKFVWVGRFSKWVYLGRELNADEFNDAMQRFVDQTDPRVGPVTARMLVEKDEEPPQPPAKKPATGKKINSLQDLVTS